MSQKVNQVEVLVVGASDVSDYVERLEAVARLVNRGLRAHDIQIELVDWRSAWAPQLAEGGADAVLENRLKDFDLVLAVIWARLDGPYTDVGAVVRLAVDSWTADRRPQLSVLLCTAPVPRENAGYVEKSDALLAEISPAPLVVRFTSVEDFEDAAHRTLAEQARRLAGKPPGSDPIKTLYRSIESSRADADERGAAELARAQRFDEALEAYRNLLERTEHLAKRDPTEAHQKRCTRIRLEVARLLLAVQRKDSAKQELDQVAPEQLEPHHRVQWAIAAAQLDRIRQAREVLESTDLALAREGLQLIELLEGTIPNGLKSPRLQVIAARILLDRGDAAEAARRASAAAESLPDDVLVALQAAGVLVGALARSLHEGEADIVAVSRDERRAVLLQAAEIIDSLSKKRLPEPLEIENTRHSFRLGVLSHDAERGMTASHRLSELGAEPEMSPAEQEEVAELARQNRVEEAERLLPHVNDPAMRRLRRCLLALDHGREDAPLADLEAAAREYPDREPIWYHLATQRLHFGHASEASEAAETAKDLLDCDETRLLLATALQQAQRSAEAWSVARDLVQHPKPKWREQLAAIAWSDAPGIAADLLQSALEEVEDPKTRGRLRLRRAWALNHASSLPEAAEEAWRAFDEIGENWSKPSEAFGVAVLQRQAHGEDAEARRRIDEVAGLLLRRFPDDPSAAMLRWQLSTMLGAENAMAPDDVRKLVEIGAFTPATREQLLQHLRAGAQQQQESIEGYLHGFGSFYALARRLDKSPPELFEFVGKARPIPRLRAPFLVASEPLQRISAQRLLLGWLELLILQRLDLLGRTRRQMERDDLRLVVFDRLLEEMTEANTKLATWVPVRERGALADLLEQLERSTAITVIDDLEAAAGAGSAESPDCPRFDADGLAQGNVEPLAQLRVALVEHGIIDPDANQETIDGVAAPLPRRFVLMGGALRALHDAGELSPLLQYAAREQHSVLVPRSVLDHLRTRCDEFDRQQAIVRQSTELKRWLDEAKAAGFVKTISTRPNPPLPDDRLDGQAAPLRADVEEGLRFREALLADSDLHWLVADGFHAGVFGELLAPALIAFNWTSGSLRGLRTHYAKASTRHVDLPSFVQYLDPGGYSEQAWRLLELGFEQAFGPDEVVATVKRFRQVDRGRPALLFDELERALVPGMDLLARVQWLGRLHAWTVWRAWISDEGGLSERLVRKLLVRARVAKLHGTDDGKLEGHVPVLEHMLLHLLVRMVDNPEAGYIIDGEDAQLQDDSPVGRLWQLIGEELESSELSAFTRALRTTVITAISSLKDFSSLRFSLPPMLLASGALPERTPQRLGPVLESLLLVSALEPRMPMEAIGWDVRADGKQASLQVPDIVEAARRAELASCPLDWRGCFSIPVPVAGGQVEARLPLETIAAHDAAPGPALKGLARHVGLDDEALYHALLEHDRAPSLETRQELVEKGLDAVWRAVREDPSYISSWASEAPRLLSPSRYEDLARMLSEPQKPEVEDDLEGLLTARGERWRTRLDVERLIAQASEVPGAWSPRWPQLRLVQGELQAPVRSALARLDHHEAQPVGRLVRDVLFLAGAVHVEPDLVLEGTSQGLGELVIDRFEGLLADIAGHPTSGPAHDDDTPDTPQRAAEPRNLRAIEPGLLRLCQRVVRGLVPPSPDDAGQRQDLWLTWRLYGWLAAQLKQSPHFEPEQLAPHLPSPRTHAFPDPHSPDFYRPEGVEARALFVVGAMGMVPEMCMLDLAREDVTEGRAKRLSSQSILDSLAKIASRPMTATERELSKAAKKPSLLGLTHPWTVPEAGLFSLIRLDLTAWTLLSKDVQLRWLDHLADSSVLGAEQPGLELAMLVVSAIAADDTHEAELTSRLARLRAALPEGDHGHVRAVRLLAALALVPRGAPELLDEIEAALSSQLDDPQSASFFGMWLETLAHARPEGAADRALSLIDRVDEARSDPLPYGHAVVGIALAGRPEARRVAISMLDRLRQRAPFAEDSKIKEVDHLLEAM